MSGAPEPARPEMPALPPGAKRRLGWLIGGRLLLASTLLGGTLSLRSGTTGFTDDALVGLIGATFGISLLFALWLPSTRRENLHAAAQLVWDLLLVTGLVYLLGGAGSGFTFLYGVVILAAAVVVGPRAAQGTTGAALTLYALVGVSLANEWIPPPPDQPAHRVMLAPGELGLALLRNLIGLVAVGALATALAERLRRTGGQLAQATEDVEAMRQKAERAERMATLGRLAAGLAHEIRNPLGSIRGSVEMVSEAPPLADEDRRLLHLVLDEVDRLDGLVRDMLEVGRPRPPTRRPTDLRALAAEIVEVAARDLGGRAPVRLVEGEPQAEVDVDPDQLRQVIWNLVKNARQLTPAEGEVRVEVGEIEGAPYVSVSDDGPGVRPEDLPHLFDVFFSRRQHGVGLGLALVQQIVEAHGAKIEVESEPGAGATFKVTLPPPKT